MVPFAFYAAAGSRGTTRLWSTTSKWRRTRRPPRLHIRSAHWGRCDKRIVHIPGKRQIMSQAARSKHRHA